MDVVFMDVLGTAIVAPSCWREAGTWFLSEMGFADGIAFQSSRTILHWARLREREPGRNCIDMGCLRLIHHYAFPQDWNFVTDAKGILVWQGQPEERPGVKPNG